MAEYSGLQYAFLGDAAFSLWVRRRLLAQGAKPVNELHTAAKALVNAKAQAGYYYKLAPLLTDAELAVMKNGRNANIKSRAKNANMADYRHATGFEALVGWLCHSGQTERMNELFAICVGD